MKCTRCNREFVPYYTEMGYNNYLCPECWFNDDWSGDEE